MGKGAGKTRARDGSAPSRRVRSGNYDRVGGSDKPCGGSGQAQPHRRPRAASPGRRGAHHTRGDPRGPQAGRRGSANNPSLNDQCTRGVDHARHLVGKCRVRTLNLKSASGALACHVPHAPHGHSCDPNAIRLLPDRISAWVVPGSEQTKRQAEAEDLDLKFIAAGLMKVQAPPPRFSRRLPRQEPCLAVTVTAGRPERAACRLQHVQSHRHRRPR